jgi:hypothetical protein
MYQIPVFGKFSDIISVTIIEVILGIKHRYFTVHGMICLTGYFMLLLFIKLIILFMHLCMEGEKSALRYAVVLLIIFFNYVLYYSFD